MVRRRPRLESLESRCVPAVAPAGAAVTVQTYPVGPQSNPAVAADDAGNYVVAWHGRGNGDGIADGVFAQRYNAAGVPQGTEFKVNTYVFNAQNYPSVAMDSDGDFVVAWQSQYQDGFGYGIYAQRFNALGVPQGTEFKVNTLTSAFEGTPSVAMDAAGDFVIAWGRLQFAVEAQRYNAAGVPQGSEFTVHSSVISGDVYYDPSVAMDDAGNFVVAFAVNTAASGMTVKARRFNAAGVAQGTEFVVASATDDGGSRPAVAMDATGNFVVAWNRLAATPDYNIVARRFNSAGVAQGAEFTVNSYTTSDQTTAAIAMSASGAFVITWEGAGTEQPGGFGAFGRYFKANGTPDGNDFHVNPVSSSAYNTAVAMSAAGDFVAAWDGTGAINGIGAQRFSNGPPRVSTVAINAGAAQRSRVTALTVTFNQAVTLPANPANAFQLKRQSDNATVSLNGTVNGTSVSLTFNAGTAVESGSLADGRYTLTVLAAQVNSGIFDGNGDGIAGDNYILASAAAPATATNIFRIFGDSDGNGTVNGTDFLQFRLAFLQPNSTFDFNNSGQVDGTDFLQFRLRFLQMV